MLKSVDFLEDILEDNTEILQKDSPQQNPLSTTDASFIGIIQTSFLTRCKLLDLECALPKTTEAKYWSRLIICNNRIIPLQLHLTQTLNTDALQRPNPGWWMHSHNKIYKQSIFLCTHMQHRQGLKLIAVSGFVTYALPYQMSFVLPSLHLSPQMSSHVMKHMGLSWHCLQTGRAFGKRNRT